jgi:hypothetical protein
MPVFRYPGVGEVGHTVQRGRIASPSLLFRLVVFSILYLPLFRRHPPELLSVSFRQLTACFQHVEMAGLELPLTIL